MLCIHGGGWIEGDKREYRKSLFQFAEEKGVGAACINYRFVSGTVCYADLLNDITAALTAIQKKGSSRKLGGLNAMRDSSNIYSTFRLTTSLGRYGFIQAPAGG